MKILCLPLGDDNQLLREKQMAFGDRYLARGDTGQEVEELQVRLAGFRGTIPDGVFGPGTELQVIAFQKDYMAVPTPSGEVDASTYDAVGEFAGRYPIDFSPLRCPCGECEGFGQGRFEGQFRDGKPRVEAFHRYEYPGIHRMLLWAYRAALHYHPEERFVITSGYRCAVRNEQTGRSSTNHHGKALDFDAVGAEGEDRREDMNRCERIRGALVEKSNAQIGWSAPNRKSLEPANIAPTWVHYDVRSYQREYLADRMFCSNPEELDEGRV